MRWAMKELTIEELTTEAMQLLPLGVDDLYMVLGCQLLASEKPKRVAGIISYLSAARKAAQARNLYSTLPAKPDTSDWEEGLDLICNELKQDGVRFLDEIRPELQKGVCNEDIISLADEINGSSMQILVMIVGAILKMPAQFESISATLAAILCKSGLRDFCR
jgi:hypothetical protein